MWVQDSIGKNSTKARETLDHKDCTSVPPIPLTIPKPILIPEVRFQAYDSKQYWYCPNIHSSIDTDTGIGIHIEPILIQISGTFTYEIISWATTFFCCSMTKWEFTMLQRRSLKNFIQKFNFIFSKYRFGRTMILRIQNPT